LPLEILVAQTQGQVGYMIESTLDEALMAIGINSQHLARNNAATSTLAERLHLNLHERVALGIELEDGNSAAVRADHNVV
jgi:hypothetical protein